MCDASCIEFGKKYFNNPIFIKDKRIIEIGSRDVNGNVKDNIMSYGPREYIGVDIEHGKNVDVICKAEDLLNMYDSESFDIVISTELMEHVYDWRRVISNMKLLCKSGGYVMITTRSFGFAKHNWPEDYWRFEVEDMKYIFDDFLPNGSLIVESDWQNPGVFVFGQKPVNNFHLKSLEGFKLYSMVLEKRI